MDYDVIDLGLTSKYATCNLGATSPVESGEYFAWGELETKIRFNTDNYLYYANGNCKYGKEGDCARLNPKINTILDSEDDVAHMRLGGSWRMPCLKDIAELHDKCTWEWTRRKGVKGYLLTSKVEGYTDRSIFLPAAGFVLRDEKKNVGKAGYYWTSELYNQNARDAITTAFDRHILIRYLPNPRYAGLCIRPVCD